MQVIATETFNTYYEGVCAEVKEGQVLDGDIAVFLLEGGSAVRPVDEASADAGRGEPTASSVVEGSAKEVLAWVDGDAGRAAEAHDAETERDKPRSTLLADLEKIAGS